MAIKWRKSRSCGPGCKRPMSFSRKMKRVNGQMICNSLCRDFCFTTARLWWILHIQYLILTKAPRKSRRSRRKRRWRWRRSRKSLQMMNWPSERSSSSRRTHVSRSNWLPLAYSDGGRHLLKPATWDAAFLPFQRLQKLCLGAKKVLSLLPAKKASFLVERMRRNMKLKYLNG